MATQIDESASSAAHTAIALGPMLAARSTVEDDMVSASTWRRHFTPEGR